MERLAKMARPDICVMTNIGYCHLENLGDLKGVLKAKTEVFKYMKPEGLAIVNGDDALLRGYETATKKLTFGMDENNDWHAENVVSRGMDTVSCDITGGGIRFHADIPAYGSHVVMAALPAAAVGFSLGMTAEEIRRGIESYAVTGGRANVIKTEKLTVIDDCYNANPNSVTAAINSLATVSGRKIAILGDMKELGENSGKLHEAIGHLCAERSIDAVICTGDEAKHICAGFGGGEHFETMDALLKKLPEIVRRGDTVLVKASHSMGFSKIVEELQKL
jgi:UDP-N-acetylmuramoyl-tripeptide--D-alanyl-D-alanine ligase